MEIEALLAIAMFACAIVALLGGFPVALTLAGTALIFALIGISLNVFSPIFLNVLPQRILGQMENQVLLAVPLFVIMGVVLERSRVAEDLLHIASRLLVRVRGGLGYAVILVGALLAASTGIVGATVISMTLIALPTMLKQGYSPRIATGTIAAAGTLGQIIPPSIVLILLADAISNANQAASGAGHVTGVVSVGDLFAGALIPGLMLVGIYLGYIAVMSIVRPSSMPRTDAVSDIDLPPLRASEVIFGLGAPLLLILSVLGSILGGLASPTEASAIGAMGAILLAGARLASTNATRRLILTGLLCAGALALMGANLDLRFGGAATGFGQTLATAFAALLCLLLLAAAIAALRVLARVGQLEPAFRSAMQITAMVFLILIGAALFSLVFRGFGGDDLVMELLHAIPGGKWGALVATMLVMFVLGFFLDFIEIVYVVVPLVAPPLIMLGVDPIWLAILMALNLQTSFLTPPFGFALFYLRGAAPDGVRTIDIWQGALPFIGLQVIMILLVAAIPSLATWLPAIASR